MRNSITTSKNRLAIIKMPFHLKTSHSKRETEAFLQDEKNADLQNNKTFLTPQKSKTVPLKNEKLFHQNYITIANNLYYVK